MKEWESYWRTAYMSLMYDDILIIESRKIEIYSHENARSYHPEGNVVCRQVTEIHRWQRKAIINTQGHKSDMNIWITNTYLVNEVTGKCFYTVQQPCSGGARCRQVTIVDVARFIALWQCMPLNLETTDGARYLPPSHDCKLSWSAEREGLNTRKLL